MYKLCVRLIWTRNPCWTEDKTQKIIIKETVECARFLSFLLTSLGHLGSILKKIQDRDGTVDRRHRSRSKAGGNDKLTTSSSSTSSSDLRSRSKLKNSKTGSVVTFSSKNESKTFTEIDEKTARSIEDSCSSGVQSGSNNSDLDSLNSASPKVNANNNP